MYQFPLLRQLVKTTTEVSFFCTIIMHVCFGVSCVNDDACAGGDGCVNGDVCAGGGDCVNGDVCE